MKNAVSFVWYTINVSGVYGRSSSPFCLCQLRLFLQAMHFCVELPIHKERPQETNKISTNLFADRT